jgi:translocation and assembly module TamB
VKVGGRIDFPPVAESQSPLAQAQLNLAAEGTVNLQIASAFYRGLFTGGLARVQTTIRGTLKDPTVSGIADVENASARLLNFPVALHDGQGRVRFTENRLLLERFVGKANEGEVSIDGGLLADNFKFQRWQFNIRTNNIVVRYPEGLRSVLDGELALRGSRQLQVLSGFLNVRRAEYTRDIDLTELVLRGQSVLKGRPGVKGPTPASLALDIRVQAADTISIRNNLANAQASAWLHVSGTLAEPLISGRATVTRGTLELRDRDYDITVAAFEFPDRPNQEMRFNVEAQADISGYQVTIGFSGTPSRFKPTLRSEPPLPADAVISLISTGRADTISLEARTLSQSSLGIATSLISEALSQQLEQRIARQRFFGINRFQVEPLLLGRGSDPTARITVGQQITKDLSITYSVNVAANDEPIVILEYKLSDRFYLVGARDERGEFSVDFRVRKRF